MHAIEVEIDDGSWKALQGITDEGIVTEIFG
jgi:hypothetical protein